MAANRPLATMKAPFDRESYNVRPIDQARMNCLDKDRNAKESIEGHFQVQSV
jgi:hypothetical protein